MFENVVHQVLKDEILDRSILSSSNTCRENRQESSEVSGTFDMMDSFISQL